MKRKFEVYHSYRGFELAVHDYPTWRWLVHRATDSLTALEGIPLVHELVWRIVSWGADVMYKHSVEIARVPLTTGQAVALAPQWRKNLGGLVTVDGPDEDGDVYADSRLVAVRCPDCDVLVPSNDRWVWKVLEEHECGETS